MSHPVQTVTGATRLTEAITRMEEAGTRRLVVVDESGNTVGIVTRHDMFKVVHD